MSLKLQVKNPPTEKRNIADLSSDQYNLSFLFRMIEIDIAGSFELKTFTSPSTVASYETRF